MFSDVSKQPLIVIFNKCPDTITNIIGVLSDITKVLFHKNVPPVPAIPDSLPTVFAFGDTNIEHQLHIHSKINHRLSLYLLVINGLLLDLPMT
ncbi:unnamed protein product [Clavelina lepadiformis]|uniref:Uncharacterized protein n=1 Tax=Clavelina lepadiformis TaxID=159417 RepID=A0ABP0FBY8_CLALP